MVEKKREAESAVQLMRATFARVRSDEEAKRGLVIIKALYGRLMNITDINRRVSDDAGSSADPEYMDEVIDVMIALQCLVKDSKLVLHEASKVCTNCEDRCCCCCCCCCLLYSVYILSHFNLFSYSE
jgi:DnaJ family protein C protein 11